MKKSKNITTITTILLLAFSLLASSVLLAVTLLGSVAEARPASSLLQEGLYAEEIEGDIDAAIKIYEQIISDDSVQSSYAAKAMYRLGMCHLKKQNERQAKVVFEKLVVQFPEETSLINKVRPLLDEMSNPDPAALMPPETKIYVELGSPGRQIERILNMLRGTPFENPLAALGGGGKQGEKSPGDMLAALLNPSMLAEFKKIRGVAVGFMCIPINIDNPPVVAVLYLGKSDALRGIILAALGMALQPGEPIEGMQTLRIDDTGGGGGAAYDDNVIIIATPLEQLTWCVKQYKGITQEPTLASQNKLFARLSRKSREDNALTIWLDGAATSAAIADQMAQGGEADELRFIDGIADLKGFEEVIASLSIRENGIGVEVKVGFKDGHQCLAYDLIRTPNLSKAGFEAVPAEAVALVSLALGESESSHAKTTQKTIRRLTGLDIGREIFANIEQLTLFAVPPAQVSAESDSAEHTSPLSCFGLAVTSHNPQRTHRLLTQLFEVADLITNMSVSEQSGRPAKPRAGRYYIWSDNDQKIYCYMDQAGSTTTLALSPEVVKASRSAQKSRQSALTAGPLKRALSELPPETSKLLLVNVGGAIRVADSYITWAFDNPRNPGHRLLAQLAQANDKTSVRLRTGENVNSFALHYSVDGLPPLGTVLPLVMQLSQTDLEAKVRATEPKPSDGAVVGAGSKVELIWEPGASATAHKVYFGTNPDELSLLEEVTETSYDKLPALEKATTYYWRIDEVQPDGSVIDGDVWSFSTGKLIGWWKLDDDAKDSSGNNHDGTIKGDPKWVTGRIDGALEFDGVDDYVDTGDTTDLPIWTVAVWVKSPASPSSAAQSGPVHWEPNFHLNWSHQDPVFRGATSLQAGGRWYAASFGALESNTWYHVCATYNGEDLKAYKDGVLITVESRPSGEPTAGMSTLKFGRHALVDQFFAGTIDDVRVYNYALSEEEVGALCPMPNASGPRPANRAVVSPTGDLELSWRPGTDAITHRIYFGTHPDKLPLLTEVESPSYDKLPALEKATEYYWRVDEVHLDASIVTGEVWSFSTGKLVGWWKFDETSGTTAADSSGNGYHGTVVHGKPVWDAEGKFGSCLNFDEKYGIAIPKEVFGSVGRGITISVWVYGNEKQRKHSDVILQAGAGDDGEPYIVSIYTDWLDYGLKFATGLGEPDRLEFNPGAPEDWTGRWNHYAFVKDADKGFQRIYLNGSLVAEKTGTIASLSGVEAARIGIAPDRFGDQHIGRLDDLRIYNYALSEDEITAIYESSRSASKPD